VIFLVFFTDAMRSRIAFKLGMILKDEGF